MNTHKSEFIKIFNRISHSHNRYTVFKDFVYMAAISLHNAIVRDQELEDEYLAIVAKYSKEDVHLFPKLLAELTLGLELNIGDFLGEIFMLLDFGEARLGQFFTPYHLSKLLADLCVGDKVSALSNKPFITLSEPTCGAGGMIIAVAQSMLEAGFNPSEHLWVEARDLDDLASRMCFLQLSLLGIPAKIITGNTLLMEENSVMYTPTHYLNNWPHKLNKARRNKEVDNNVNENVIIENIPSIEDNLITLEDVSLEAFIPNEVEQGENFSLF